MLTECDTQGDVIETDYSNSQSLHSMVSSNDDGISNMHVKWKQFNAVRDLSSPNLEVGMQFESLAKSRELVRQYAYSMVMIWTGKE